MATQLLHYHTKSNYVLTLPMHLKDSVLIVY
jgi:hypothetical protein